MESLHKLGSWPTFANMTAPSHFTLVLSLVPLLLHCKILVRFSIHFFLLHPEQKWQALSHSIGLFASLLNAEYLVLSGNAYNTSIPIEIGQLPNLRKSKLLCCMHFSRVVLINTLDPGDSSFFSLSIYLFNLEFLYVQNAFVDGDLTFMDPMQSIGM